MSILFDDVNCSVLILKSTLLHANTHASRIEIKAILERDDLNMTADSLRAQGEV